MKTLKEIYGNKANGQISVKELRAEAVKWFKELRTPNDKNYYGTVEDWIKHFFNLTEEDLKEVKE